MNMNSNSAPHTLQPSIKKLLFINIVLAILTLLANGSALVLGFIGKAPEILTNLPEAILIISGAVIVLATAVLAIVKPHYWKKVLSIHTAFLTIGTVILLLWGLNLASQSLDSLLNFVEQSKARITWSVGWLTAIASYSAFLVSITFFAQIRNQSVIVKYAYIWVGVAVFLIDVFIFYRLVSLGMQMR